MSIVAGSGLAEMPTPVYKYVTSTDDALRDLEMLERHPIIELDIEATGLDPLVDRVVLLQIGIPGISYVYDVRDERVDARIFKDVIEGTDQLKLDQNAVYEYEMLKSNFGMELNHVYDPMLSEQLLYLGLKPPANLQHLVSKYLSMFMEKDVALTFQKYDQEYQDFQKRYAANDVCVLRPIYECQLPKLRQDGLMRVAKLEFDFIKALGEMELNGMLLDVNKWRELLDEKVTDRDRLSIQLTDAFGTAMDQVTLFGVSLLNLNSPAQLLKCLHDIGIPAENTDEKELSKYKKNPIIQLLLEYKGYSKFISTYGEPMIGRIHPSTGRLHTSFRQMVDTGRMSSSDPNLQNIPKEQKYRACFIARPGYKLITVDMSQAELRILAEYSKDPVFLECFAKGIDLHGRTASDLFDISYEKVMSDDKLPDSDSNKLGHRRNVKALNFGLVYGLTRVGLALRLGISEDKSQDLIDSYFNKYRRVKDWLDRAAKFALMNRYSTTVSGRRRYFKLPPPSDPTFNKLKGHVERQGKNHPIQGSNADTIKQSMTFCVDRIKNYDARLLLTVHDEIIVEAREDQVEEVKPIVENSVVDGFAEFFSLVKMKADAKVGNCWMK
jgi:DNA polymerase I-like protein with 3'-5' exonuclease and polymerase domains